MKYLFILSFIFLSPFLVFAQTNKTTQVGKSLINEVGTEINFGSSQAKKDSTKIPVAEQQHVKRQTQQKVPDAAGTKFATSLLVSIWDIAFVKRVGASFGTEKINTVLLPQKSMNEYKSGNSNTAEPIYDLNGFIISR